MRIAHTMLRVVKWERSIAFYTEKLEMNLFRREDYPEGEFTLAFLGYGDEQQCPALELTYSMRESSHWPQVPS
jgi:lactoylglutathione lyase